MTTEIEKTFFDTLGIEPIKRRTCSNAGDCPNEYNIVCDTCDYWRIIREDYPEITDRILLELICIAHTSPVITFVSRDVEKLKEEVLMVLCHWVNCRDIKNQVQAIFKKR